MSPMSTSGIVLADQGDEGGGLLHRVVVGLVDVHPAAEQRLVHGDRVDAAAQPLKAVPFRALSGEGLLARGAPRLDGADLQGELDVPLRQLGEPGAQLRRR